MAALMRHGGCRTTPKEWIQRTLHVLSSKTYATKAEKKKGYDQKQPPKIVSTAQSIAAKGFLRAQNSYLPPVDVDAKLDRIFQNVLGTSSDETSLSNLEKKFVLCTFCEKEFEHSVPSSILHSLKTLRDVRSFYETPVDTRTPLDKLRYTELPENLHIQFDYHRFHPETDTKFNGQTAFNRRSTIVTGLKYKEKYKGHVQNEAWPFNS